MFNPAAVDRTSAVFSLCSKYWGWKTMAASEEGVALHADIEAEVAKVIAACDGDPLAAVRALIVLNAFLESEVARLTTLVSRGFARGGVMPTDRGAERRPITKTE